MADVSNGIVAPTGGSNATRPAKTVESGTGNAPEEPRLSRLTTRRAGIELVLLSFVVLFQELALIRWIPVQGRVIAYFPNLVLISAFLGLGVGCLQARRRSLFWSWTPALLILVGVSLAMSTIAFTANSVSEHLWLLYYDMPEWAPVIEGVRIPIIAAFVLSAASFVPLGQQIAQRLEVFRVRSNPLWGYAFDLGGSLLGVVAFAALSFVGTFPVVWFGIVVGVGSLLFLSERRRRTLGIVAGALVVIAVGVAERSDHYSPYYAISTRSDEATGSDVIVLTNGSLHQIARPLRKADPVVSDDDRRNREGYHYPYDRLRTVPRTALVLGAGTGNDVAVLLDQGVEHIDVVEIDPVILDLGRAMHPNRPYASERVEFHNTDARSFLNDTDRTYDLVVFGTLDSMTRLSALSSVRLDNFVYTLEGVEAARERLNPGGGLVMYFAVGKPHIHENLFATLSSAFGEVPVVESADYILFNTIYMAGPAFRHLKTVSAGDERDYLSMVLPASDVPTDDWPYLYLETRSLSWFYLSMMGLILAIASLWIFRVSGDMRDALKTGRGIDLEMFLFGVAFLLIETRFVTAMNLVWGATWLTSAVVFGSILLMVLAATLLTGLRAPSWRVASLGLILSLAAVYLIPTDLLVGRDPAMRLLWSVLLVGTPVFFASVCFALRFRTRDAVDVAFGWNLLGAVAGGLIEFFSMSLGLKALLLVAIVAYLLVILLRARERGVAPA